MLVGGGSFRNLGGVFLLLRPNAPLNVAGSIGHLKKSRPRTSLLWAGWGLRSGRTECLGLSFGELLRPLVLVAGGRRYPRDT